MDLGISGKIAVVAGGSRGCGRGIAEALAREGVRVVLTGRERKLVDTTVNAIRSFGGTAHGVVAHMAEKAGASAIVKQTREIYGDPDILVINSPGAIPGTGPSGRYRGFDNTEDEDFDQMHQFFVMSTVYLVREVVPAMKQKNWGRLLNIGSIAMKNPHLDDPMPAVNIRVGVNGLMKTFSQEFGPHGITANVIATGPFDSEMSRAYRASQPTVKTEEWYRKMLPVGRWGQPKEMGCLAAFLCSERAAFITGETIRIDGGYTKSLF